MLKHRQWIDTSSARYPEGALLCHVKSSREFTLPVKAKLRQVEIVDRLLVVTFQESQKRTKVPVDLTLLWLCQREPKLSVVSGL